MYTRNLSITDPEIAKIIEMEHKRQVSTLNLVASDNYASTASLEAQGSILAYKLAEGYPNKRVCGGCDWVDEIERLAIKRLKKIFGAEHANVQAPSGTQANMAVYFAALKQGDKVLAMDINQGGHFTHGSKSNVSGQFYDFVHYGVKNETGYIDYENALNMAKKHKPKMIITGASAYPRIIDFKVFKEIADKVGAYLLVDMAHISGLIIADIHPSPIPYADFVTSSTHKTLRGPRGGGIILCKEEHSEKIDKAIFPGTQGAPMMNVIAARAVIFKEAMSDKFKQYQIQVVQNSKTLANRLMENEYKLVTNGTDNHLMLVNLSNKEVLGKESQDLLDNIGIIVNPNRIPYEKTKWSGIRLGTPALTTRGMKEKEMLKIADLLTHVLNKPKDPLTEENAKNEVRELANRFPLNSEEWSNEN
jgi:glycine hydroxymethyltransferase